MRKRATSLISRMIFAVAASSFVLSAPVWAQRFAETGVTAASATSTAAADEASTATTAAASTPTTKPVWHETAVPTDKEITAKVTDGVLTVDGLVAKVQLNYDINHAGYLYFYVPGVGTAVVSRVEMYGSTKVKDAFHGTELSFSTGGHSFELSNRTPLAGGKNGKGDVYVRLDATANALDRYPMVGYGSTTRAPYAWPMSGISAKDTTAHLVTPPPIPANLLPRTESVVKATQK